MAKCFLPIKFGNQKEYHFVNIRTFYICTLIHHDGTKHNKKDLQWKEDFDNDNDGNDITFSDAVVVIDVINVQKSKVIIILLSDKSIILLCIQGSDHCWNGCCILFLVCGLFSLVALKWKEENNKD